MKINRRGQGSLEYLMILAAVLAIAVVVVVLASSFLGTQRVRAVISQQKADCATFAIDIPNYVDKFPASRPWIRDNIRVIYKGATLNDPMSINHNCTEGDALADTGWEQADVEATCSIGDTSVNPLYTIHVNSTNCTVTGGP